MIPYVLVSGDFVTTGGMDRANHALALFLAQRGNEVHLVAHRTADDLLAYPNILFHRVPKPANSYFLAGPLLDCIGRHWARKISARGGRVIVNGGNCQWADVNWVHYVHAAYRPTMAGNLLRRAKGRWSDSIFTASERNALRSARLIIANSARTKHDLMRHLDIPDAGIEVIYYGTDSAAFRPTTPQERFGVRDELGWYQEKPVIAFVGALGDRRKGFDALFDAWTTLCSDNRWDADLAVIGAGSELETWRSRARQAGLAGRIHFLGFRSDVPSIVSACDVLVAPTRYEAYGLGVHEALCCGLPAIVTSSAGIAERIVGGMRELLLSDPPESKELVDHLRHWRRERARFGEQAYDLSSLLRADTWDQMARQIVAFTETEPGVVGSHPADS